MRIFLDANILFSAAKSNGPVRELVSRLVKARHTCCVDGFVVEEARRNLAAKFPEGVAALDALLAQMEVADRAGVAELPALAQRLPAKDQPVIAAALALKCDALVTGDKTHFGFLYGKRIGGVVVYSPRMLAEALL